MSDHVWSCLILSDTVWYCLILTDPVWSSLILIGSSKTWAFKTHTSKTRASRTSDHVWSYLILSRKGVTNCINHFWSKCPHRCLDAAKLCSRWKNLILTLIDFSFRYKSNFFVTPTPESAPSALSRSSNVFWRKTNQVIFQLDYRWPGQFYFVTFTFWIVIKYLQFCVLVET